LNLYFVAQMQPFHDYLITIKKHARLFPLLGVLCVAAVAADFLAIRLGLGIEGVAAATVIVFFGYFTAVFFMAGQYFSRESGHLTHYLKICAIFVYMATVLFLLQGDFLKSPSQDILFYVVRVFVYLVAYLPLLVWLNREVQFWHVFSQKLSKFFKKAKVL